MVESQTNNIMHTVVLFIFDIHWCAISCARPTMYPICVVLWVDFLVQNCISVIKILAHEFYEKEVTRIQIKVTC